MNRKLETVLAGSLVVALAPLGPLAAFLIKRQKWPYNENGPVHRYHVARGLIPGPGPHPDDHLPPMCAACGQAKEKRHKCNAY